MSEWIMSSFMFKRKDLEKMLETKLIDIVHELPKVIAVEEDMPIEIFVDSAKKRKADAAIVIDRKGRISGIVTRLDLLKVLRPVMPHRVRIFSMPLKVRIEKITIKEIMTPNPIMLPETARIRDAVELMNRYRISHVIITDTAGKPKAIISRKYMLRKFFGIEEE